MPRFTNQAAAPVATTQTSRRPPYRSLDCSCGVRLESEDGRVLFIMVVIVSLLR